MKYVGFNTIHPFSSIISKLLGKTDNTVNVQYLNKYLDMSSFSDIEIKEVYSNLSDNKLGVITQESISDYINNRHINNVNNINNKDIDIYNKLIPVIDSLSKTFVTELEHKAILPIDNESNSIITTSGTYNETQYEQFRLKMYEIGESIDDRVWPVALCNILCGISIGILMPCMPLLASQINISSTQYGIVVAAFGVSRLMANIPAGYFVDRLGRKPFLVGGMGLCGLSIAGAGLTLVPGFGIPWLVCCRLMTGISMSGLSAGSQMYVADISNTLNRARMFVPLQTSFHFGMVFGPVLGGGMIEAVGISGTFFTVGAMCGGITILNQVLLKETMKSTNTPVSVPISTPVTVTLDKDSNTNNNNTNNSNTDTPTSSKPHIYQELGQSFKTTFYTWKSFSDNKELLRVTMLNGTYWYVLAGTQMTLLPIMLTAPPFDFNAGYIGAVFAYMSTITVVASPYMARLADKYDKVYTLLGSSCMLGLGVACIPYATNFIELCAALAPMAIGSTALSIIPVAYSADIVTVKERAQAQSLIRTSSDIGFVLGATSGGILADALSMSTTISMNSGVMVTAAAAWFITKKFATKITTTKNVNKM